MLDNLSAYQIHIKLVNFHYLSTIVLSGLNKTRLNYKETDYEKT